MAAEDVALRQPPDQPTTESSAVPPAAPHPLPHLDIVLKRFRAVARQLATRSRGRPSLVLNDEYDVQYLLGALLAIDFDDVRPEEPSGSVAGRAVRIDFLCKRERVVIEVKKTREALKDKEVGDELLLDIARYKANREYSTMICFVYDPDHFIRNPAGLKTDLENQSIPGFAISVSICQG